MRVISKKQIGRGFVSCSHHILHDHLSDQHWLYMGTIYMSNDGQAEGRPGDRKARKQEEESQKEQWDRRRL